MKNLKKVLSLALAFAMVLGLCIGASAADVTSLNDWDEVENQDAATLLGAFDIMKGDDEGNFRPNDNVTRAETAKMISVALWGGSDDVALYNAGNIGGYTDVVSGAWYMGYVNYMTVQSIVTGKGEGVFDPNGNVTGYELLKMCLVSLGYSPEVEHLTGAGWDVRTMALATKPGFQNLTAKTSVTNWNAPLSRTNAAQIIANMIYRNRVTYNLTGGVGGNTTSIVVDSKTTFGESVLGMTATKGILVANPYGKIEDKTIKDDARNYKGENAVVKYSVKDLDSDGNEQKNQDGSVKMKDAYINVTLNTKFEDLGLAVQMYIVNGKVVSANMAAPAPIAIAWKNNDPNQGTTNIEDDAIGYLNNAVKTPAVVDNDGKVTNPAVLYTGKELAAKSLAANCEVRAYDTDNDGYIELVMAYEYAKSDIKEVKTVTDSEKYGNVYGTTNANWRESTYAADADKIPSTFIVNADFEAEKGDKVVFVALENVFEKTATHGYVLGVVEGKVTRISTDATTVYIDGVKYSNTDYTTTGSGENKKNTAPFGVGSEGTFWTYANGAVAASDTEGGIESDTYALVYDAWVTEVKTSGANRGVTYVVEVSAILPDGTNKVFEVASITENQTVDSKTESVTVTADEFTKTNTDAWFGNTETLGKIDNTQGAIDTLLPYTLTDGKINLILNAPAATAIDDGEKVSKGVAKTDDGKLITSDTVTYVQTADKDETGGEKWAVFKGTNTPSYTVAAVVDGNASTSVLDGDYVKFAAITVDGRSAYGEAASGFFVLLSTPDNAGTNKYVAKIYNGETNKVEEITYTAANANAKGTKGGIYKAFGETTGFGDKLVTVDKDHTTGVGMFAKNDDNAILIYKIAKAADTLTPGNTIVDKDTKFFHINGDDTTSYVVADLNDTISAMDDASIKETYTAHKDAEGTEGQDGYKPVVKESTKYNMIVVDGSDGYADFVITFENAQKLDLE